MYVNDPKEYQVKLSRIKDACALKQPDTVPVLMLNGSWSLAYSKVKIQDVLYDPEKMHEAYLEFCKDIYTDGILSTAVNAPFQMYDALQPPYPMYKVTPDGYCFEHYQADEEHGQMRIEEYSEFIKDMQSYTLNVLGPRRFPLLKEPYPANYEALKKGYSGIMTFMECMVTGPAFAKKRYGIPVLGNGFTAAPLDELFVGYRGIRGILTDIRRNPQNVLDACEVLEDHLKSSLQRFQPGEIAMMPLMLAPYLNAKQFEKFYWPGLKRLIDLLVSKNARVFAMLEGDWMRFMDYFLDFPEATVTVQIEYGDLGELKKKYGKKIAIAGGMSLSTLKYSSKEECCDQIKKVIDVCAPGGGYIFTTDKSLSFQNDINVENYQAVVETVRKYGKY